MPVRYTLEEVVEIFKSNNCTLLDSNYTNQLQKLHYIASCGHSNIVSLKEFLTGQGLKCKPCALNIPTYESVVTTFSNKGCSLSMTEEEFKTKYKTNRSKLDYIASCGHHNSVCWANFTSLNQGICCPTCIIKMNTEVKIQFMSGDNKNCYIEQEYKCIQHFVEITKKMFQVKKTFDGCKTDIVLRPNDKIDDLWLGIQVKSTCNKTDRGQYYFRLNGINYDNYLLLCICLEDKKMWLIPYEDVKEQKTIGIAVKSKYNLYEVTVSNIQDKLIHFYEVMSKFDFDTLNTPTSDTQKQEQHYRKLREAKLDFITFVYPDWEGTVYDFTIGTKKIQEKVGFICKNNPNLFGFKMNKSDGRHFNCSYKLGDNDLYWLHCKNTTRFYVIPESVLIEKGIIGDNCKQHLYISPTNIRTRWTDDYLFDYNNLDKEKLLQLLIC